MSISVSSNALASVQAALANPSVKRTEEELAYDKIVSSCVFLPKRQRQKPLPDQYRKVKRAYTVTTIAASVRYGGTRTVAVCSSLNHARKMVERNYGDIYEASYRLAVIEAIGLNCLYTHLCETYWYKWDGSYQKGRYRPIKTPKAFERSFGFGVG